MIIISVIAEVFPVLMKGVKITVIVLGLSAILGYSFAFIAGLCRLSKNIFIRTFTSFYVEIFRGTSLIVQLFWFYYAIAMLFGIEINSTLLAGVLAISLNYGACMCEIVRASIVALCDGQLEGSLALAL